MVKIYSAFARTSLEQSAKFWLFDSKKKRKFSTHTICDLLRNWIYMKINWDIKATQAKYYAMDKPIEKLKLRIDWKVKKYTK